MSTLINRLFNKSEAELDEQIAERDQRYNLLDYLADLGSSSTRLTELKDRVRDLDFPSDEYLANLHLVQFYLAFEDYLIYHDPRYINSEENLRKIIQDKFSELTQNKAFKPLYETKEKQEILLGRHYIEYLLLRLKAKNKTSQWQRTPNFASLPTAHLSLVESINQKRKLKELSENIFSEYSNAYTTASIQEIFVSAHADFETFYGNLKSVKILAELVPQGETKTALTPPDSIPVTLQNRPQENVKINVDFKDSVLENLLDGFVLFDRQGSIIEHNSNAAHIFGLQKLELKKHSIHTLLPAEISQKIQLDLDNTDPLIQNTIIGTRLETEIENTLGDNQDYEITITNNYTEEKDTYSIFLKNITNKKDTLNAINEAKINAERMAKAKSTFLSNMSHEIRTPLNVILGLSEIISKSDLKNKELLKKNVEGIDFSAQNLLSIVNDILDFSKIEAGKLTIQSIDFNLPKLVDNLANGFEIKAQEKGLRLVASTASEIPDMVVGDQYRLNQILTNLIGNAIKFTQKGEITIEVKQISANDNDIQLEFIVTDTGVGIPESNLKSIFDSFFQVENPENSKVTGTGLGLAITKELIELQNGILTAESEINKGSIFKFMLPFKRSKLKKVADAVKNIERQDEKLKGLRVLVAEDNKMNQFYIKQLLNGLNVEVDIAEDGEKAVEIFKKSSFDYDLIFMDMHMPIMNGLEAISIIRKSNKNSLKKVPIVACSADVFPEARKNAIKAGIDFYLTKPLSEDAIKEVLFWLISDEEFDPQIAPLTKGQNNTNATSGSVDIDMLRETFDNDDEFIISLLEIFIKETPEDFKSMRICVEREFYSRASSLAHKMKSSFMNLGMTLHGHHLQQIESNFIKPSGLEEGKKHLDALCAIYNKTLLEVNILLIELKQG